MSDEQIKAAAEKHAQINGVREIHLMGYTHRQHLHESFTAGANFVRGEFQAEIRALHEIRKNDAESFTTWVAKYDALREQLKIAREVLESIKTGGFEPSWNRDKIDSVLAKLKSP